MIFILQDDKCIFFNQELLQSTNILKVGVGIQQDVIKLEDRKLIVKNVRDLSEMAKEKGLQERSLSDLNEKLNGKALSKAEQQSNWDAPELSRSQIQYAADDVRAAYSVYQRLLQL